MNTLDQEAQNAPVRIDKWLWAARFFKTRSLAIEAVNGGKVHVDGDRVKPSKKIQIGMRLEISIGLEQRTVLVRGLAERRGSASIAQSLYEETSDSIKRREEAATIRKYQRVESTGKPDKRGRRQIKRFKDGY
ncbi:MAG: S4 domain-containing protein [Gammaproteobacteria bacterium]|nr:S4 domain-containing protein [Gammaproteobacteria bacterium]MDH5694429.1 S4 domain-containing protein [Gammaproteobacteria bacterium]